MFPNARVALENAVYGDKNLEVSPRGHPPECPDPLFPCDGKAERMSNTTFQRYAYCKECFRPKLAHESMRSLMNYLRLNDLKMSYSYRTLQRL